MVSVLKRHLDCSLSLQALFVLLAACMFAAKATAQVGEQDTMTPPEVLLDAGLFRSVSPEHAKRVSMTWEEVLADVASAPWPESEPVKPAGVLPQQVTELVEDSSAALKQGQAFRAVQLLREAQELAPDHPSVKRALGLAYAESGNLTRATDYLRQIVSRQRDDVEALLLLTRHAAQRGALDQILTYAEALRKNDSAATLADYFLARALMDQGYANAAASRLSGVIAGLDQADAVEDDEQSKMPRLIRHEMLVVREMLPTLRVMRGDLYLRSGKLEEAAEAYADITLGDHTAQHALIARRVYLALLAGDQAEAIELALSLLVSPEAKQNDTDLVSYLLTHGVPAALLAQRIEVLLQAEGITLPRLLAFAQVAESDRLLGPVKDWIASGPVSPMRLNQAVSLLTFDDHRPEDAIALADLLILVADLMEQSPKESMGYARAVLADWDAPVTLLRAIRSDRFDVEANNSRRFLMAVAYEQVGRFRDALAAYRLLFDVGGPLFEQSILPTVRLHLSLGEGEEAHAILGEPVVDAEWDVFSLSLRAMAQAGKSQQAIGHVDQRIKTYGKQLRLDVLRIELIAEMGQPQPACNLLLRLISSHPNDPALYRLGIDLAYDYRAQFNRLIDAERMRRAFLTRLISNLPDAPLARISMAQNIRSNPSRVDEAEQLLLKVLEEAPDHLGALVILTELYDEKGDAESAAAMHQRYAQALRPGFSRALAIAERALAIDDNRKAAEVLDETLKLDEEGVLPGPAMTGDDASALLYRLGMADPKRDTDAIYLAMVRRFPDHPSLNNALGYRWASEGRNLLQAKAMIDRALDVMPADHSILDSKAWVLYKLGQLNEAKETQTRALQMLQVRLAQRADPHVAPDDADEPQYGATTAILNDHMGDILYQLGDTEQALSHWRVAQKQEYSEEEKRADPELMTLPKRLKAKIDAMAAGKPVPVAEIPGPEAHGPAGHPAEQGAKE